MFIILFEGTNKKYKGNFIVEKTVNVEIDNIFDEVIINFNFNDSILNEKNFQVELVDFEKILTENLNEYYRSYSRKKLNIKFTHSEILKKCNVAEKQAEDIESRFSENNLYFCEKDLVYKNYESVVIFKLPNDVKQKIMHEQVPF
jgi:hypothetical protein